MAFVVGSTLCASGALAAPREIASAAPEAGRFDGAWTIEVATTVGSCPALMPDSIDIEGDRVAETPIVIASNARTLPWGYVESDGTFVARFTTQGRIARAHGQLRGNAGSGAWSSSTDMCGGTWKARRGGAERAGAEAKASSVK
ncbi:MAG: hypothetical protein C3F11_02085 [Methylocystaceae bacterium]|nr:MAG: hypothetical protein C3F11_02085 [Methylocystaceae bacterium]